jgi:hypothetical protein
MNIFKHQLINPAGQVYRSLACPGSIVDYKCTPPIYTKASNVVGCYGESMQAASKRLSILESYRKSLELKSATAVCLICRKQLIKLSGLIQCAQETGGTEVVKAFVDVPIPGVGAVEGFVYSRFRTLSPGSESNAYKNPKQHTETNRGRSHQFSLVKTCKYIRDNVRGEHLSRGGTLLAMP